MAPVVRTYCQAFPPLDGPGLAGLVAARCAVPMSARCDHGTTEVAELRFVLDASRPSRGRDRLATLLDGVTCVITFEIGDRDAERADVREAMFAVGLDLAQRYGGFVELDSRDGRSNTFHATDGTRLHRL